MIDPLLTPQDVADLLQISVRTVYKKKHLLGGFYLPGIKVLRFPRGIIYDLLQGEREMALRVPAHGETLSVRLLQHQGGGPGSPGRASDKNKKRDGVDQEDRHGLLAALRGIP